MIQLFTRIMIGDLIWFCLGGAGALLGWWLAAFLQKRWARVLLGLLLAFLGILLVHAAYETFMAWYTTPLAPAMKLNMPQVR